MAVVTDNFTYSTGNLQTVSSGRWSDRDSTADPVVTSSGTVWFQFSAAEGTAVDTSVSPGADQYGQATLTGMGSTGGTGYIGIALRHDANSNSSRTFYAAMCIWINATTLSIAIGKYASGAWTYLVSFTNKTWTDGDILKFSATGTSSTVLTVYRNGTSILSATDSSSPYTSGSIGLYGRGGSSTLGFFLDSWEGGDVAGGSSVVPAAAAFYRMLSNA
jgi:hypothetical protein